MRISLIFRASPAMEASLLRWLVLDLNSFFASCEQQEHPELRDRPLIVVQTMAETTCAIAASYPAKALGIKTGTLVYEARRLCPHLKLVQANHKRYVAYHHRILRAIEKHIPVHEVMSIDEVVCRLDKRQQQPTAARELAQDIKREIETQVGSCLTSSIGISANKLLAKLASNMQKPNGLVILPVDNLPRAILHLQLRDIPGIGPSTAQRLQKAGITDIATLWSTDASRLRLIWGGVAGAKMHALLHGEDIVSAKHARSSIGHQHVLAPEERTKLKSAPVMRQLLARAAERLRDEGFFCRRLTVEVKWLGRERDLWSDKRTFPETQDTGMLLRALEEILREVPDRTPLRIGVALSSLAPAQAHQPDLFDKPSDARLMTAIDRLNAKFGKSAITYGTAGDEQTSKIAFQRVPKVDEF